MSAESRAKRNNPDLDVTVLEKTMDVSYSACGMPYNIADPEREIEDLVVRQAHVFREKQDINLLTGHCAESIDPVGKTVSGTSFQGKAFDVSYDKLLIATGGAPIIPVFESFDSLYILSTSCIVNPLKVDRFSSCGYLVTCQNSYPSSVSTDYIYHKNFRP